MKTTFDEIIEQVLEHEGGYVNDPDDPGGETNFGIAKRSHPDVDIKNLTKESAKEIYFNDYWKANNVDKMPDDLKHIYFDMCVNMGVTRAVSIIQQTANGKGMDLAVDGKLDPNTLKAAHRVSLDRVRSYRIKYYARLTIKKPNLDKFWYGWYKRSMEV